METITERAAAGLVELWCEAQSNRASVTDSTINSIKSKCRALIRFLSTENEVTEKTCVRIIKSGKGQYGYRYRLCAILRTVFDWAVENLILPRNPLFKVKLPRPRYSHRKKFLTDQEVERIKLTPLAGRLAEIRDIFVIQCYSGLAYADVQRITKLDLYEAAGMHWIRIIRKKTHTTAAVPVTKDLLDLLDKYEWTLNVPNNQEYNERLKEVQRAAGIEKHLHSHLACKTFVQHYLHKGMHVEETAKMRGITAKTLIEHYGTVDELNLATRLAQIGL